MATVPRLCRQLLLAVLSLWICSCGTQSSDHNALPSWIAPYPGSPPQPNGSAFVFQTKDDAEKILNFYEQQLARSGVHKEARGGGEYGGFLSAADDSHSRNVMIDVRAAQGTSQVTITPVQKK